MNRFYLVWILNSAYICPLSTEVKTKFIKLKTVQLLIKYLIGYILSTEFFAL